ncbi:uncharacterized protein cd34 isoform X2 [Neoarius graeffei]|uniref:uncharacterized protein cd34 isoform X2 n=1 Tax=Neoarius graeffei TaxID=443677 RepID=UPI00298CB0C8|nr:uncharacterized protein cd34 isoform X2 [Neoarius graeffei]
MHHKADACQGQDVSTAAVSTDQTITTAVITTLSTHMSPGGLTDPSTTNPTDSPATDVKQGTDHPGSTTQDTLPGSAASQTDTAITNEEAHEILATSETTTSQPVVNSTLEDFSTNSEINDVQINQNESGAKLNSPTQSGQTQVFISLLVSGLILAAALIGLYVWKIHCHTKANGMKLAEESYMADEDNQGNTLVSVAPLNPPESQEKPSQNGESLEVVKTQNPLAATNGHSTTKADTEL